MIEFRDDRIRRYSFKRYVVKEFNCPYCSRMSNPFRLRSCDLLCNECGKVASREKWILWTYLCEILD